MFRNRERVEFLCSIIEHRNNSFGIIKDFLVFLICRDNISKRKSQTAINCCIAFAHVLFKEIPFALNKVVSFAVFLKIICYVFIGFEFFQSNIINCIDVNHARKDRKSDSIIILLFYIQP